MLEQWLSQLLRQSGWLVPLLQLYWFLATASAVLACLPLKPKLLREFQSFVIQAAARGKLWDSAPFREKKRSLFSRIWRKSVPKSYFSHFYLVGALFSATLLYMAASAPAIGSSHKIRGFTGPDPHLLIILLLEIHLLRRLWESVMVSKYSKESRMHIAGYLFGISYYIAVPLSLLLHDSSSRKRSFFDWIPWGRHVDRHMDLNPALSLWTEALGVFLFVWASFHQHRSHRILARLRTAFRHSEHTSTTPSSFQANDDEGSKQRLWSPWTLLFRRRRKRKISPAKDREGFTRRSPPSPLAETQRLSTSEYSIPHGDWFEFVSCPHYLAETVIYLSFVVLSGGANLTVWLLFAWVVANLVLAAKETHKWYQQKFPDYPKKRKALIPKLF